MYSNQKLLIMSFCYDIPELPNEEPTIEEDFRDESDLDEIYEKSIDREYYQS